jgi:hypothetical protein
MDRIVTNISKANSKLLNLYSKVLNTYIGNYSIHKTATAIPDFQQTGPSCSNACVAESGANEILFFAIP